MSDLRVQLIIDAQNNASGAVGAVRNDVRGLDDQMGLLEQRFNQFIAFKIAEVGLQWAASLIKTADNYQTLDAKIALVTDSYEEQLAVQKALFDMAIRSRTSLENTTSNYIKNADAIKRMGGSTEQALAVTETLNKAVASTSQGLMQDSAAMNQFSQALGRGTLQGEELGSILENSVGLSQALADGLDVPRGKLKELGEQGKLTGIDLINALLKVSDQVDERFSKLPLTVEQGWGLVVTQFTKYSGEANKTIGVTHAVADALEGISKHIPELIQGSMMLVGIYGIKLTAGLTAYIDRTLVATTASAAAAAAAEHEAVVNLELLRTQAEVTAIRVRAARAIYEEERLQRALAATAQEAAAAQERLAAATRNLTIAEEAAITASLAYRNTRNTELLRIESETAAARLASARATEQQARAQLALASTSAEAAIAQRLLGAAIHAVRIADIEATAATRVYNEAVAASRTEATLAATATNLLSKSVNVLLWALLAYEGLSVLGQHFEDIRMQMLDLKQDAEEFGTVLKHVLKGDFLNDGPSLEDKLQEIQLRYGKIKNESTDAALAETERTNKVTEAIKQEEIQRTENFKTLQSQLKETSTQVDAEYTRQTNTIKTALEQQKNAIAASALPEIQKEAAISKAIADANAARLLAIQEAADKKLQLIANVYDAELAKLKAGTIEQKAVEKQSIEERIALYTSLEKNYQQVIDGLISEEQRHAQAVKQLLNDRENLEQDTQDAIRHIRQAGMDDQHLLADQQKELDENLAKSRQALIAGDTDNAKKYGEEAAKLAQQLATQAESAYKAGRGYSSEAERFISKFKDARKSIGDALEKEQSAHQEQQAALSKSISESQTKLDSTKTKINELSTALRDKFLLKINADTSAVDQAIARIEQPTESVHTIHVVEDNASTGGTNWNDGKTKRIIKREGNSYSYGYQPVDDAPQGLQDGGFPRVSGLLPGYGGGDRIPALLEEGEFVLNKEAVAKNGASAIHALNNGDARVNHILRLSSGGGVGSLSDDPLFKGIDEKQLVDDKSREVVKSVAAEMVKNWGLWNNANPLRRFGASDLEVSRVNKILDLHRAAAAGGAEAYFYDRKKLLADALLEHVTDPANPESKSTKNIKPEFKTFKFDLPQSVLNVAANPASSKLQSSSSDRSVTVEFKFPNTAAPIAGHFQPSDVDQLLSSLKDAAGLSIAGIGSNY